MYWLARDNVTCRLHRRRMIIPRRWLLLLVIIIRPMRIPGINLGTIILLGGLRMINPGWRLKAMIRLCRMVRMVVFGMVSRPGIHLGTIVLLGGRRMIVPGWWFKAMIRLCQAVHHGRRLRMVGGRIVARIRLISKTRRIRRRGRRRLFHERLRRIRRTDALHFLTCDRLPRVRGERLLLRCERHGSRRRWRLGHYGAVKHSRRRGRYANTCYCVGAQDGRWSGSNGYTSIHGSGRDLLP